MESDKFPIQLHLDDILHQYNLVARKTGKGLFITGEFSEPLYNGLRNYVESMGCEISYGDVRPTDTSKWYVLETDKCDITVSRLYR